ncbi:MAG: ComEC/Rec2 family competence protein, partial [Rhodospirillales bacterium]|nr:ComEC/Rec2 family competence protein [Rhodospirillales bacterium]
LSISGLHMSMVAGLVFMVVRGALALIPFVALRYPIKKWTAGAALAATWLYLLLAGAPVPAQRSFLSLGIVLLAVLFDRTAISLRSVAWAAMVVMVWHPDSLVGASFQMSFAAVVALVAFYEVIGRRLTPGKAEGWFGHAAFYVLGVVVTTLVASAATSVYGIFHFSRFTTWGMLANALAVPLAGVWVMPAALLAFALMPFGLDAWPLTVMGWGVELTNHWAEWVASLPLASVTTPILPLWAMLLFTAGGLWLCLWRRRWRLLGLVPMLASLAGMLMTDPPDLLVDGDTGLMAARAADGGLMLAPGKQDRFERRAWMERAGNGLAAAPWPRLGESPDGRLRCDELGCVYRAGGHIAALVRHPAALTEDCRSGADVLIGLMTVRRRYCPEPAVVLGRFDLWRDGAHALWLRPEGVVVESVGQWQGNRPWGRRRVAAGGKRQGLGEEPPGP